MKICGLFREEDIAFANELCPDYVGFVFAQSRRKVTETAASALRRQLRPDIPAVGVFQDDTLERIQYILEQGIIQMVQLHGGESCEYIERLKKSCDIPVMKAFRPSQFDRIPEYELAGIDYVLFDNEQGGSGQCFDWSRIPAVKRPFFLAGGIQAGNVENAIRETSPFGVDVNSGAETNQVKDKVKMQEIIRRVRYGE